jgi:signal transduction histidine kinase
MAHAPHFDDVVDYAVVRLHDRQFWRMLKSRITDLDPAWRAAAQGEAPTGDGAWLAWQSRPLPDGATLVGFADVTDARRLERALAEREAALETAERLKSDFVAAVSRELRTPLTTVLGYAELLEADSAAWSGAARERLAAVRSAAGALARSIGDILAIAELDAGTRGLNLEPIALGDLVAGALAARSVQAKAAGIELRALPGDPSGEIQADRAALEAMIDHLIENALAHTGPGGVIAVGASRAHGEVRLSVADTGRGIPFDIQPRLFERFTGLEGGVAGLGLPLVKALAELHGGWVSVESEPGCGATFTCHLPEDRSSPKALSAAE